MRLQIGDVARDRRCRHRETFGRAREAPLLDHLGEHGQRKKSVHDSPCLRSNLCHLSYFIPISSSGIIGPLAPQIGAWLWRSGGAVSEAHRVKLGATLLRMGLGAMFISHALLKYFV